MLAGLLLPFLALAQQQQPATPLRIAVGAACYPTHAVDAPSLRRQAATRPIVNWRGGASDRPERS